MTKGKKATKAKKLISACHYSKVKKHMGISYCSECKELCNLLTTVSFNQEEEKAVKNIKHMVDNEIVIRKKRINGYRHMIANPKYSDAIKFLRRRIKWNIERVNLLKKHYAYRATEIKP